MRFEHRAFVSYFHIYYYLILFVLTKYCLYTTSHTHLPQREPMTMTGKDWQSGHAHMAPERNSSESHKWTSFALRGSICFFTLLKGDVSGVALKTILADGVDFRMFLRFSSAPGRGPFQQTELILRSTADLRVTMVGPSSGCPG